MRRWVICQEMAGCGYAYYNANRRTMDSTDATLFTSREAADRALSYLIESNAVANVNCPEIIELDRNDLEYFIRS